MRATYVLGSAEGSRAGVGGNSSSNGDSSGNSGCNQENGATTCLGGSRRLATQSWAVVRRGLIKTWRWPLSGAIRFLLIPGIVLGAAIYGLSSGSLPEAEQYLATMVLLLTSFHFYLFGSWLVADKESGFKSLMLTMGLQRTSYLMGNSLVMLLSLLPIMWAWTSLCLAYLFKDTLIPKYHIVIVLHLFVLHLIAYTHLWASLVTRTGLNAILLIPLIAELFMHDTLLLLLDRTNPAYHGLILLVSSASPYESIRTLTDSYQACLNCDDEPKYYSDLGMVSEPIERLHAAMLFWTLFAYLFALWFDEICPYKTDSEIKSPLFFLPFCPQKLSFHSKKEDNEPCVVSEKGESLLDSNYFELSQGGERESGAELVNLSKQYNRVSVVSNLSLKIYKGETTLLLGHNGAGKTTLMNMMLGKVSPDGGYVSIKAHGNMGVCPQSSVLDDNLSVRQHLELFLDIKCIPMTDRSEHIRQTIEDVGLKGHEHKVPDKLSGGMKRKLSLGMAFVGKSSLLILDEPSSGLDPDSRVFIWNAIRRYRGDRTVLLSTQHMEEADYLGDRIAIMSAGSIICCGSSVFLNQTFGTGYKLRVECSASTKLKVLEFVRQHFERAQVVGDEEEDDFGESEKQVDFVVELNDDKTKDLEEKLIAMLEKMESSEVREELKIRSHGLRSSSIEDVMLNTSKWQQEKQTIKGETRVIVSSSLNIELAQPKLEEKTSSGRLLWAQLVKHWQVYKGDWKTILFFRILVSAFCLWHRMRHLAGWPIFDPNFITCCMVLHYIQWPIVERLTGFKIVQLTSRLTLKIYWLAQLMVDSLSFLFNLIAINILLKLTFKGVMIKPAVQVHLVASAAVLMYSWAGAMMAYALGSVLPRTKSAIGIYAIFFTLSIYASVIVTVGIMVTGNYTGWVNWVHWAFVAFLPSDAFQYIMFGLYAECYVDLDPECRPLEANYSPLAIGFSALGAQIAAYTCLLYLIEAQHLGWATRCWRETRGLLGSLTSCCRRSTPLKTPPPAPSDTDVLEESARAAKLVANLDQNQEQQPEAHSLVVSGLSKSFLRNVSVIDGLSFGVRRGECFGLLGVNGAGKSTTFALVVGEQAPDAGRIQLARVGCLRETASLHQHRRRLGYAPQPEPDIALTSREALTLMARLRGVEEPSIASLVDSLIQELDMGEHAQKRARDLSGGTKRKLALAMSLVGAPSLLALDEPTAGVDPVARRRVWRLLRQLRNSQNSTSILISSHAMEECEAICDRISIMSRGRLRCIGTFLQLRSKYSRGCSLRLQFNRSANLGQPNQSQKVAQITAELSQQLEASFGPQAVQLTDSNANSATFAIADEQVRRSQLFKILRQLRQRHSPATNLSYMVNDSSLEDIFLAMAREQQEAAEGAHTQLAPSASLDTCPH